ncbi:MAG: hypothetical protein WCA35_04430 [Kovacikia sp.]
MLRRRPNRAKATRPQNSRTLKLVSRDLDLLLLAGCSCLLTVLYHPVAEALQSAQSVNNAQVAVATQTSKAPVNSTSPIHTTLPPRREAIKEEEDA